MRFRTGKMPTTPNGAPHDRFSEQAADADQRLAAFLAKYPVSANAVDAYWLGRSAERSGNPAHARSDYKKAIERFPQTYFAHAAATRLSN